MKDIKQVVWTEGMLLGQQHFQLWDRYTHARQNFHRETIAPLSWGLVSAEIDQDALQNGQFQLTDYSVIFPDGTIATHGPDEIPLSCTVTADSDGKASVYIAVPANQTVSGISGYRESAQLPGNKGQYQEITDEYDHARTREVLLSSPHVHLLTDADSRDAFVSIKLAQLIAEGDERFRIDEDYIPPSARIRGSQELLKTIDRLLEVMRAKIRALSERRRQRNENVAEFSNADVAHFWLLNNLNSTVPELSFLRDQSEHHPEQLFLVLSHLAGSLCTFSLNHSVESLPRYVHTELGSVFKNLEKMLRDLIDTVIPSNFSTTQLQRETDSLYSASQFDWQVLDSATFYLGVQINNEDKKWIEQFERLAKMGSRESIEMIVSSAMPGVRIHHEHRPPSQLPIRSKFEYFRVDSSGEFWDAVIRSSTVAVYVPQTFAGAAIELMCVQE